MSEPAVLVVASETARPEIVEALQKRFVVRSCSTIEQAATMLSRHARIGVLIAEGREAVASANGLASAWHGLRCVLLAAEDLASVVNGAAGARVVASPWRHEALVSAVLAAQADAESARTARLATELAERRAARIRDLENAVSGLGGRSTRQLAEANVRLRQSAVGLARLVSVMAEGGDPDDSSRRERVARTAVAIGRRLGWAAPDLDDARMAALLTDVGRAWSSGDPPGFDLDGRLAERSAQILSPLPFSRAVIAAVRHRHERWNGLGAPAGMRGAEIPRLARLLALADAYVTLVESDGDCPGLSEVEAAAELRHEAGRAHDPEMVEALVAMVTDSEAAKALPELELAGARS